MLSYMDALEVNSLFQGYGSEMRALFLVLPLLYLALQMKWYRRAFLGIILPVFALSFLFSFPYLFGLSLPFWMDRLENILYLVPLAFLLFGRLEWRKGTLFFKYLFILMGVGALFYGLLLAFAYGFRPSLFDALAIVWREASMGYPRPLFFSLFTALLLLLLLMAAWDLMDPRVRGLRALEELTLRNELTTQSLRSMERTNQALATVRHDEMHHLRTLVTLFEENPASAAEYARSLTQDLARIPTMRFTENLLVNTILSVQSARSAEMGVLFSAKAILPTTLSLPEQDLTVVLMNLLENAIEAAAQTEGKKMVNALLLVEEHTLRITISNSLPRDFAKEPFRTQVFQTSKAQGALHGFGIPSAQKVVERYSGTLRYRVTEDRVTVQTAMVMGREHLRQRTSPLPV